MEESTRQHLGVVRCPRCGAALVTGTCPRCGPIGALFEGKWEVTEKIAEGGMGQVFLARDAKLDRHVALKTLSPGAMSSPELLTRFEREGRALAKMDHPNVVPVYATGLHEGRPFMVMKYVTGKTLSARMKEAGGALSLDEVLPTLRDLCAGLTALHAVGIVHRDLKPANVMLTPDGRAVLLDLGVASVPGSELTVTGMTVGTPAYMSPEQARGEKELDGRADLYAVAAIVFHALAGRPPFIFETDALVLRAQAYEPAPPLKLAAPGVPAELASVIDRALAKRPGDRQADVATFLAELEVAARGFDPQSGLVVAAPVRSADSEGPTAAATPSARLRSASRTGMVAVGFGVVAVLGVGAWWMTSGPPPAPPPVPAPVVVAPVVAAPVDPAPVVVTPPVVAPPIAAPPTPVRAAPKPKPAPVTDARPGTLRVAVTVKGALSWGAMTIDGAKVKDAPTVLELPPGKHRVRITHEGFAPLEQDVTVEPAAERRVVLELSR